MSRLPNQPGELINRDKVIRFTFDGKPVEAYEGDTVGSALYADGRRTFSRSFKYHRRRGLLCCAGQCPNCIVAVDGAPGVRACTEPVREGMEVEHLNAQPGLELDVMRATDIVGTKFTPPGFYYKTFIRPRKLWPLYEKVLRHAAGLGVLRKEQPEREWRTEYRRRHADVLVIGGGSAGQRAAAAAAGQGDDVVLVDEGPLPIEPIPGVEILARASALGYFDGIVPVWQGDTLHQIRARRHVFATGAIEQPLVFAGNDLPGVMLSGGALRLAQLYAVRPGTRAVVASTSDRGLEAAAVLQDAGVQIVAVADLREARTAAAEHLTARGIEVLVGHAILEAKGGKAVEAAVLGPIGVEGASVEKTFDCDLVVVSGGFAPATSLLLQAGARTRYDAARGCFVLDELPTGVEAVGDVAGVDEEGAEAAPVAVPPPVAGAGHGKCFACLCEDVTAKDIKLSVEEGYDSIELSKRYTTVTMGPCQGRMCQLPAIRLMAKETGQSLEQVGTTTARPPWVSVPMGILAGRPFEPAKRSSIHGRHRALGANIKWAGDWRRAYDYGDPEAEALAVHEAAGLIDVSTLGKLLVRGPDAGEFLDRLYPNRFSDLGPGRIRYGVISSDAGRIVDDGTICRIDDDTFYVTTTSSGAGAVEEWFSWWLADWRMRVQLTDLTQGTSAVNLAGPRAREILERADRAGLLGRGVQVPRRQAGEGRRRPVPDPADRIRRRGRLRDPLRRRLRRARVGRADAGGPRQGHPAVRARAAADPAAAEDAHPRRAGHRLRVDPVRRRDAVDRQARQGGGFHRQVGARALRRGGAGDPAGRVYAPEWTRADRGRGDHGRGRRPRRPGHELALLAGARPGDRDGLGAEPARARRLAGDDLGRGHDDPRGHPDQAVLRPGRRGAPLVSLAFLELAGADAYAVARSPMEGKARAAGARFEIRDGWNVAVEFPGEASAAETAAWADVSHLRKLELQGESVPGELGEAKREGDAWICQITPARALLLGGDHAAPAGAVDVTTCFAALTVFGPQAREVIARFCALDLRPQVSPPGSFRPGSIARQPGMILVQDTDRFLLLFGWAVGEYMWSVVDDAARSLDGGPVGSRALKNND